MMQTFMNIGISRKSITTQSPITIQFQSSLKNRPSAAPLRLLHLFEKDFSCPNYKVDHQLSLSPSFFLLQLFNIGNLCDHFPIPIIGSYRWEGWVGSVFLPSVQVSMIQILFGLGLRSSLGQTFLLFKSRFWLYLATNQQYYTKKFTYSYQIS